jgi:hypothetical protein
MSDAGNGWLPSSVGTLKQPTGVVNAGGQANNYEERLADQLRISNINCSLRKQLLLTNLAS